MAVIIYTNNLGKIEDEFNVGLFVSNLQTDISRMQGTGDNQLSLFRVTQRAVARSASIRLLYYLFNSLLGGH